MTGLHVAALLLLCIGCAEALRCHCVYEINGQNYINTKQTCQRDDEVCVSVYGRLSAFGRSPFNYRRCMKSEHAKGLMAVPWLRVKTCETDFCN